MTWGVRKLISDYEHTLAEIRRQLGHTQERIVNFRARMQECCGPHPPEIALLRLHGLTRNEEALQHQLREFGREQDQWRKRLPYWEGLLASCNDEKDSGETDLQDPGLEPSTGRTTRGRTPEPPRGS